MTLASKLLEGYYPEEGGYVLEGMTPEVMMNQVNAICTECITGLYEAAQQYFTDDIIGQAEVITEGAGIIDKIKEAIGKFVQKVKDIWAWFVKKVKAFPAWIKGLFTKSAEATAEVVQKAEKSIGINHKMVPCVKISIIEKCYKDLNSVAKELGRFCAEGTKTLANVTPDEIISNAREAMDELGRAYTAVPAMVKDTAKEISGNTAALVQLIVEEEERLDEGLKVVDDAVSQLDNAKQVEPIPVIKAIKLAKDYAARSKQVSDELVKPLEKVNAFYEKSLKSVNSPGLQKELEKIFISGFDDAGGKGQKAKVAQSTAQTYITALSQSLSASTKVTNKSMSCASKISSAYMKISSKLRSAAAKGKSGGEEGNSDNKPAENKE